MLRKTSIFRKPPHDNMGLPLSYLNVVNILTHYSFEYVDPLFPPCCVNYRGMPAWLISVR